MADLETPVSAFLKIQQGKKNSFLLESVTGGEHQARYSFIGSDPYKVIVSDGKDPLLDIEGELEQFRVMPLPDLPALTGGGIGFISYDCVKYFEPSVPIPTHNPLNIPESVFMFCDSMVVFDHRKHLVKLVAHVNVPADHAGDHKHLAASYEKAVSRLVELESRLKADVPPMPRPHPNTLPVDAKRPDMPSNHGPDGYKDFVHRLKKHIVAGDIIQAVPSQRLARPLRGVHSFDVYRHLRVVNPSPYMFYVDLGDFQIVGASPEQLVKVQDGRVTTHPIAGTRRRGKTEAEDLAMEKELLDNEKERAEHIMLVDLGRNDVGRISTPGSVRVDSLMHVERYSHVMHIVSHVSGQLAPQHSVYDALRAVFPAGTVSGAPKIRAMQLVAECERERRGIYAGAVGYISYTGVLDVAIAIRTMMVKDGVAYLQAGSGIVFDSDAQDEHDETINKMMGLAVAIDRAESFALAAAERRPPA